MANYRIYSHLYRDGLTSEAEVGPVFVGGPHKAWREARRVVAAKTDRAIHRVKDRVGNWVMAADGKGGVVVAWPQEV